MGAALAAAALDLGHEVVIVSGPVPTSYPPEAEVHDVVTTDEMLQVAIELFGDVRRGDRGCGAL